MEEVKEKLDALLEALKTLEDGVAFFYESEETSETNSSKQNERIFLSARDSIIQRFEYCIDLFWKVAKIYLEQVEKITLSANSPRGIVRQAVAARLLSEDEGDAFMDMIEARNKTSHTYHEAMAEKIAHQIPEFYELMQKIAKRMEQRWHEL